MKSINKAATGLAAILLLVSFSAFAASHREAPLLASYNFLLEVEGTVLGRFTSVDGLGAQIEVVEFREGGEGDAIRKIPGRTTYSDIVLKRGYTATDDLWDWMQEIIDEDFVTKNGSIRVIAKGRSEVARFNIFNAWPSKYQLGVDDVHGTDIAIEELTLTVERIELE
jgi:phage tail-like protein